MPCQLLCRCSFDSVDGGSATTQGGPMAHLPRTERHSRSGSGNGVDCHLRQPGFRSSLVGPPSSRRRASSRGNQMRPLWWLFRRGRGIHTRCGQALPRGTSTGARVANTSFRRGDWKKARGLDRYSHTLRRKGRPRFCYRAVALSGQSPIWCCEFGATAFSTKEPYSLRRY
jgi:hypothetical protein